jgi:hypothetical protein
MAANRPSVYADRRKDLDLVEPGHGAKFPTPATGFQRRQRTRRNRPHDADQEGGGSAGCSSFGGFGPANTKPKAIAATANTISTGIGTRRIGNSRSPARVKSSSGLIRGLLAARRQETLPRYEAGSYDDPARRSVYSG